MLPNAYPQFEAFVNVFILKRKAIDDVVHKYLLVC